jgi:hypothetical protein
MAQKRDRQPVWLSLVDIDAGLRAPVLEQRVEIRDFVTREVEAPGRGGREQQQKGREPNDPRLAGSAASSAPEPTGVTRSAGCEVACHGRKVANLRRYRKTGGRDVLQPRCAPLGMNRGLNRSPYRAARQQVTAGISPAIYPPL